MLHYTAVYSVLSIISIAFRVHGWLSAKLVLKYCSLATIIRVTETVVHRHCCSDSLKIGDLWGVISLKVINFVKHD